MLPDTTKMDSGRKGIGAHTSSTPSGHPSADGGIRGEPTPKEGPPVLPASVNPKPSLQAEDVQHPGDFAPVHMKEGTTSSWSSSSDKQLGSQFDGAGPRRESVFPIRSAISVVSERVFS